MTATKVSARVAVARALAQVLLEGMHDRWRHTAAVAERAAELAVTVDPADRELLVVAAWLHDIGYSPALCESGFHSLDGARYLQRQGWPQRLSALVAHHSGAVYVAENLGLREELEEFERESTPLADALTYADQTVGPTGQRMTVQHRMAEVLARHGNTSAQAKARPRREPYLLSVAQRVEDRLLIPCV